MKKCVASIFGTHFDRSKVAIANPSHEQGNLPSVPTGTDLPKKHKKCIISKNYLCETKTSTHVCPLSVLPKPASKGLVCTPR